MQQNSFQKVFISSNEKELPKENSEIVFVLDPLSKQWSKRERRFHFVFKSTYWRFFLTKRNENFLQQKHRRAGWRSW